MRPRYYDHITRAVMLLIALITWTALGLQLYILVGNAEKFGLTRLGAVARFLAFFTILTNLLVAISLTSILVAPNHNAGRLFSKPLVQAGIGLNIFIVGIIYNTVLRSLWQPEGLQKWADELLHVAVPLLFVGYWLAFVPKGSLKWKSVFVWIVYPAFYLVYALTRGALSGFYPYPFLDVSQLGYTTVFINAAGLLLVFILTGLLFVGIDRIMSRSARHSLS